MTPPDESKVSLTRTQRRAQQMRRVIVDIAESLYIDEGVAAVNAETIAARADISVQTVYNRVGVRDALLVAITEKALSTNRAFMDETFTTTEGNAEQRVLAVASAFIEFARTHRRQFRLLTTPPGPAAQALVNAQAEIQIGQLAQILDAGMDEGLGTPGLNTRHVAIALWAMLSGLLAMTFADDTIIGEEESEAVMTTALNILRDGLLHRQ
ncbi:TetR/AcrR family transcriptional regulator [Williamsia sp. CHRR-6]|uniref:TetR/AcrR family transcriptional regulator n=1 Tax=Williamsia sp. CHRR-6 TaxID=2835871 RepID=UPI001BDA3B5E|nr:TetR/AcrR family transcriptional regulator [Williamsia sp. CHRR-6]MBT0566027.1 TetR/AcrR family transcriptional regulator [Williamsia sp. CHRR-6]